MYIGELIKKYREQNNLSMQEFANRSGLSKAYIGMLEKVINPSTGKPISPSLPKMQAIARAMNMSLDDLLPKLESDQEVIINTQPQGYYTDPEVAEIADRLKNDPKYRLMFDASKDLSKEDIDTVLTIIEGLKARGNQE